MVLDGFGRFWKGLEGFGRGWDGWGGVGRGVEGWGGVGGSCCHSYSSFFIVFLMFFN